MTLMPSSTGLSVCLRMKAVPGGLEVFWCLCWDNWVIAASGALPVAWEHARSPVPTQPCTSQDDILNRLLWALLSPAPLAQPWSSALSGLALVALTPPRAPIISQSPPTCASAAVVAPAAPSSALDLWVRCCLVLPPPLSWHGQDRAQGRTHPPQVP